MAETTLARGRWRYRVLSASVLFGSMAASYLGVSFLRQHGQPARLATAPDSGSPTNPFASVNGTHLIAFVITASDCGWSSLPTAMEAVRKLRTSLHAAHDKGFAQITVVGVALDEKVDAGIQFLADIGKGKMDHAFDQVVVGGSWLNEQIVRFVWREGLTEGASPQIILIGRPVNTEGYPESIAIDGDTVLTRVIGTTNILRWIKEGVPLNYNSSAKGAVQ